MENTEIIKEIEQKVNDFLESGMTHGLQQDYSLMSKVISEFRFKATKKQAHQAIINIAGRDDDLSDYEEELVLEAGNCITDDCSPRFRMTFDE